MKRKANYLHWFWSSYDRKKVEPGLLEAIGHLTFLWNDIEESLDRAFMWAIECPSNLQIAIRSRIHGLDGKIEIIKTAVSDADSDSIHYNYRAEDRPTMLTTLQQFAQYKRARDAIIHARASEITAEGIARTSENQGFVYEVILTLDAVSAVNSHLEVFQIEMHQLSALINLSRQIRPPQIMRVGHVHKPPDKALSAYAKTMNRLRECQKARLNLKKIPELHKA